MQILASLPSILSLGFERLWGSKYKFETILRSTGNNYFESSADYFLRRNIEIPLVKLSDFIEENESSVVPLPSSHLPDEASTLNLYAYNLTGSSYERLLEKVGSSNVPEFGMIVTSGTDLSDDSGYVGAVGCAVQIIALASKSEVLTKGIYRFIVKEVIQSFPYTIAVVDEFVDRDDIIEEEIFYSDFEQDLDPSLDNDQQDEIYPNAPPSQLLSYCVQAMESYMEMKLDEPPLTPLQISILEDNAISPASVEASTEEKMAVLQIFLSDVLPETISPLIRNFAVAMLTAEIAQLDNNLRRSILETRDGIYRMKLVLKAISTKLSQASAEKMTQNLSKETSSQDLEVGVPTEPSWVARVKKGQRLEYYWNEECDWCPATVIEVNKILHEYIFTLKFDIDGEIHKIPFSPEDKVRWRPIQNE